MSKGGIFEAGFGEILCFPHLQWAGKRKFASRFTKPSLPDPTLALGNEAATLPNVRDLHQRFGNWRDFFGSSKPPDGDDDDGEITVAAVEVDGVNDFVFPDGDELEEVSEAERRN